MALKEFPGEGGLSQSERAAAHLEVKGHDADLGKSASQRKRDRKEYAKEHYRKNKDKILRQQRESKALRQAAGGGPQVKRRQRKQAPAGNDALKTALWPAVKYLTDEKEKLQAKLKNIYDLLERIRKVTS